MSEPILDPDYWKRRLAEAGAERHHAVFRCPSTRWRAIAEAHRKILAATIGNTKSVLDVGCGWGRLLDLMPVDWRGIYLGVDISPDFIALAVLEHPDKMFMRANLLTGLPLLGGHARFDWAVLVSIRPMVKRNLNDDTWTRYEIHIRCAAKRLLYLEYDESDPGSIE